MKKILRIKQTFLELKEKTFWRVLFKVLFKIVMAILVLSLICGLAIGVQFCIEHYVSSLKITNNLNATWVASLPSYWGGILGGVISGSLAVIGVVWTIKYYKSSDATKNRIEHMPFFAVEIEDCYFLGSPNDSKSYTINSKTIKNETKRYEIVICKIILKNIGKWFAYTTNICFHERKGEFAFNKLIQSNDQCKISFNIILNLENPNNEVNFEINYLDCMSNEYMQEYSIQWKGYDRYKPEVHSRYPKLKAKVCDVGKIND